MASFTKFNSFVEAMAEKAHNLGSDQLVVGLTSLANAPVAGDSVLADLTEVTYTNCSSRNLTTGTSAQTAGTYKLTINDITLTASGGTVGPLQYVFIYNDTASSDELIGFYDYGPEITLADGESLAIDFDGTNGVLTIA